MHSITAQTKSSFTVFTGLSSFFISRCTLEDNRVHGLHAVGDGLGVVTRVALERSEARLEQRQINRDGLAGDAAEARLVSLLPKHATALEPGCRQYASSGAESRDARIRRTRKRFRRLARALPPPPPRTHRPAGTRPRAAGDGPDLSWVPTQVCRRKEACVQARREHAELQCRSVKCGNHERGGGLVARAASELEHQVCTSACSVGHAQSGCPLPRRRRWRLSGVSPTCHRC